MGQGDHPAATMTRTQRSFNIKCAFEVNPPELIGKKIFYWSMCVYNRCNGERGCKMVPGGLMCLYSAEWIWEKGLAFKAGRFFLQAEIRRSKNFCSA